MKTIDEYLSTLPEPEKHELQRVRTLIHAAVPEATEGYSYGMPAFYYHGKYLGGFAMFKHHLSLFPTSRPIDELKHKLAGYKLSTGTIQFTTTTPLSDTLIKEIFRIRQRDIDAGVLY